MRFRQVAARVCFERGFMRGHRERNTFGDHVYHTNKGFVGTMSGENEVLQRKKALIEVAALPPPFLCSLDPLF